MLETTIRHGGSTVCPRCYAEATVEIREVSYKYQQGTRIKYVAHMLTIACRDESKCDYKHVSKFGDEKNV